MGDSNAFGGRWIAAIIVPIVIVVFSVLGVFTWYARKHQRDQSKTYRLRYEPPLPPAPCRPPPPPTPLCVDSNIISQKDLEKKRKRINRLERKIELDDTDDYVEHYSGAAPGSLPEMPAMPRPAIVAMAAPSPPPTPPPSQAETLQTYPDGPSSEAGVTARSLFRDFPVITTKSGETYSAEAPRLIFDLNRDSPLLSGDILSSKTKIPQLESTEGSVYSQLGSIHYPSSPKTLQKSLLSKNYELHSSESIASSSRKIVGSKTVQRRHSSLSYTSSSDRHAHRNYHLDKPLPNPNPVEKEEEREKEKEAETETIYETPMSNVTLFTARSSPNTPTPELPDRSSDHRLTEEVILCKAVHAYKPELDDEVELCKGDWLVVEQMFDDGWCFARFVDKDQAGICPKACLAVIDRKNKL